MLFHSIYKFTEYSWIAALPLPHFSGEMVSRSLLTGQNWFTLFGTCMISAAATVLNGVQVCILFQHWNGSSKTLH